MLARRQKKLQELLQKQNIVLPVAPSVPEQAKGSSEAAGVSTAPDSAQAASEDVKMKEEEIAKEEDEEENLDPKEKKRRQLHKLMVNVK